MFRLQPSECLGGTADGDVESKYRLQWIHYRAARSPPCPTHGDVATFYFNGLRRMPKRCEIRYIPVNTVPYVLYFIAWVAFSGRTMPLRAQ